MKFSFTFTLLLSSFVPSVVGFSTPSHRILPRTSCIFMSSEGEDAPTFDQSYTLFVGNLPFDTNEEDLRQIFLAHGNVESLTLPMDKKSGRFRGFAFIKMASQEACDEAVENLQGSQFGGRQIRVSQSMEKEELKKKPRAPPKGLKKIYVGNLPFETTNEDLKEIFEEHGEVIETYVPIDQESGSSRGFGFVTVKEDDFEKMIEATNGMQLGGRGMVVSEPLPPGQKPKRGNRVKLYVGNLSFYTEPETLSDKFSEFGEVYDCYMPEDRATGGSRGFGFVTMDKEAAKRALKELNGFELDGRTIRVNEAQAKGAVDPESSYGDPEEEGVEF